MQQINHVPSLASRQTLHRRVSKLYTASALGAEATKDPPSYC